jgi:anti-sigma regulatory factor (Ser/Thr protein kinase)
MRVTFMRLAPRPESARAARRAVSEACARARLERIADDARLVTSELVTNAVAHARTLIDLTLRTSEAGLRIEVADGSSVDPWHVLPDEDAPEGRGLTVVDQVALVWGSEPHGVGKVVWAEIA